MVGKLKDRLLAVLASGPILSLVFFLLTVAFSSGASFACSIPRETVIQKVERNLANMRVKYASDCSYVNGGVHDDYFGAAAKDGGKGRVLQFTFRRDDYAKSDMLISVSVADCTEQSFVVLDGVLTEAGSSCGPEYALKNDILPNGPIDLSAGQDMDGFEAHLEKHNASYSRYNGSELEEAWMRRDRLNPYCGCKIFYPDSPGARR